MMSASSASARSMADSTGSQSTRDIVLSVKRRRLGERVYAVRTIHGQATSIASGSDYRNKSNWIGQSAGETAGPRDRPRALREELT